VSPVVSPVTPPIASRVVKHREAVRDQPEPVTRAFFTPEVPVTVSAAPNEKTAAVKLPRVAGGRKKKRRKSRSRRTRRGISSERKNRKNRKNRSRRNTKRMNKSLRRRRTGRKK